MKSTSKCDYAKMRTALLCVYWETEKLTECVSATERSKLLYAHTPNIIVYAHTPNIIVYAHTPNITVYAHKVTVTVTHRAIVYASCLF